MNQQIHNPNKFEIFLCAFLILLLSSCAKNTVKTEENVIINASYTSESKRIAIHFKIPKNLHAYLDKGKDGQLIPISFDWQPLQETKAISTAPVLIQAPQGELNQKEEARVLRDEGIYIFELKESLHESTLFNTLKFRVRTQICNEVAGICYKPSWTNVFLK